MKLRRVLDIMHQMGTAADKAQPRYNAATPGGELAFAVGDGGVAGWDWKF